MAGPDLLSKRVIGFFRCPVFLHGSIQWETDSQTRKGADAHQGVDKEGEVVVATPHPPAPSTGSALKME